MPGPGLTGATNGRETDEKRSGRESRYGVGLTVHQFGLLVSLCLS